MTAARLFGTAETLVAETGLHRDPADEAFLGPLMLRARAALGEPSFVVAESSGRALSYDAAMKETVDFLERGARKDGR